jgi:hypothetical protein
MLQYFATKTPRIVFGRVGETFPCLSHNVTDIFQREDADCNVESRVGEEVVEVEMDMLPEENKICIIKGKDKSEEQRGS